MIEQKQSRRKHYRAKTNEVPTAIMITTVQFKAAAVISIMIQTLNLDKLNFFPD
jgi:hypothetical protein